MEGFDAFCQHHPITPENIREYVIERHKEDNQCILTSVVLKLGVDGKSWINVMNDDFSIDGHNHT